MGSVVGFSTTVHDKHHQLFTMTLTGNSNPIELSSCDVQLAMTPGEHGGRWLLMRSVESLHAPEVNSLDPKLVGLYVSGPMSSSGSIWPLTHVIKASSVKWVGG